MSERWMVKSSFRGYLYHVLRATALPTGYWQVKAPCGGLKAYRMLPAFAPEELTRDEASRMLIGREAQGFDVCKRCLARAQGYAEATS